MPLYVDYDIEPGTGIGRLSLVDVDVSEKQVETDY